jgi:hypothetical protein
MPGENRKVKNLILNLKLKSFIEKKITWSINNTNYITHI